MIAPAGPVYQAGTLSGNPLSVAAGLATLRALQRVPDGYDRLEALGAQAEAGLREALAAAGVRGCVNRVGSMLTLFLGVDAGARLRRARRRADTEAFAPLLPAACWTEGVYLPPSQFEAMFLSLAHDEADIDRLVGGCPPGPRGSLTWAGIVQRDALRRGMAMAFEFTGTIAAGAFLGWYLDESFRAGRPWGSIVADRVGRRWAPSCASSRCCGDSSSSTMPSER